jgi:hypothetical protein
MKKILALMLCTILLLGLTACGNNENDKENNNNKPNNNATSNNDNIDFSDYFNVFSNRNYHMVIRLIVDDVEGEIEVYVKDEKISTTTKIEDEVSRMLILGNRTYIIMDEDKLMNMIDVVVTEDTGAIETGNLIKKGTGKGEFDGRELPYDEYLDNNGSKVRFFVENEELVGIRTIDDGITTDMIIEVFDQNIPDNIFDIPKDYKLMDY